MKKSHNEIVTKEMSVIDDIICNKCGKSTKHGDGKFACFEGTTLRACFGYGSNKDGLIECFDLCDDCFDEIINTFIHKPSEREMNIADFI